MIAHAHQRLFHRRKLRIGAPPRRQFRRCRFYEAAQFKQIADKGRVGFSREHPGEHLRVQHIPADARQDARARLGSAFQHALCHQNAHRFPIGCAGYAQPFGGLDLAFENIAGLVDSRDDGGAKLPGNGLMDAKPAFLMSELAFGWMPVFPPQCHAPFV